MIELRRADIGFGRVLLDERGILRRGLVRSTYLAWERIREYRLAIELGTVEGRLLGGPPGSDLEVALDDLRALVDLFRRVPHAPAAPPEVLGIELVGDGGERVAFNWRFRDATSAIGHVLARIAGPLTAAARAALDRDGIAGFGPLELCAREVRWEGKPLAREAVESIELFDSSPVRLRVMARGRAWPHGQAVTRRIPNVLVALELAHDLGYRVRARRLLDAVRSRWPDARPMGGS